MSDGGMRFRVGLFVLLALGLLGALVVLFGSLPGWFRRTDVYTVRFTEAPGLTPGAPVRRSGVRIGQVRDILLDDERGIVRVQVAVNPRFTIRRNDQPTLVAGLLGGDVGIDFIPQPPEGGQAPDRAPVQPGAELVGVRQANVNTLLKGASEVVPTTQEAVNEMRKSMQRLERSVERLTPLTEETLKVYRDLGKSANEMMPDLKKTNEEYQKLARDARNAIPDLKRTNEDVAALARTWNRLGERINVLLESNQDKIVKAIDQINDVLTRMASVLSEENQRNLSRALKNTAVASDSFPEISRNTEDISKQGRTTVRRLNDSLVRADQVLSDLQKTSGPLGERGPAIVRNLDESLAKLNVTLADVQALTRVLDASNGLLRRVVSDPSLYIHLDEAAAGLARAMPRVDRVLKDFETFADKLARHPELLGAGGILRPSNGLKNPPTPPLPPPGFPVVVPEH